MQNKESNHSIKLLSLEIENFKGIKQMACEFGEKTVIQGRNATGKTSIMDAFMWLLWDKNAEGNSKFNIRPLNKAGEPIHNVDISVEATLDIDGYSTVIKKVQSEKWVRPRGAKESEMKGSENSYTWNEIPIKEKDFKDRISDIISEDRLKILTDIAAFPRLPWKAQRQVLLEISGEVTIEQIILENSELAGLAELLTDCTEDELKAKLAKARKDLTKTGDGIPARIDELMKQIVEVDETALKAESDRLQNEINELSAIIEDKNKISEARRKQAAKLSEARQKVEDLIAQDKRAKEAEYRRLDDAYDDAQRKYDSERRALAAAKEAIDSESRIIRAKKEEVANLLRQNDERREEYKRIVAETLSDEQTACPTCHRPLEGEALDRLKKGYEAKKKERLDRITKDGMRTVSDIDACNKAVAAHEQERQRAEESVAGLEESVKKLFAEQNRLYEKKTTHRETVTNRPIAGLAEAKAEMERLEEETTIISADPTEALKADRKILQERHADITSQLIRAQMNDEQRKRIAELEAEQKEIAIRIAQIEGQEYSLEQLTLKKADALERNLASHFRGITWKLFEKQVNGGIKETCTCEVNGVPYADVNTAGKINAGITIAETLQKHYGITAPIWIDNTESVLDIQADGSGQIIMLQVADQELQITKMEG